MFSFRIFINISYFGNQKKMSQRSYGRSFAADGGGVLVFLRWKKDRGQVLHGGGGFRGGKNSHKLRSLFKNFSTSSGDFEVQMMVLQKLRSR